MSDTAASTNRLVRTSALLAVGTLLSRLSGFLRIAILAAVLGYTRLTDTYNLANETPNIVYELFLGGILTATFVPIFVDFFDRDDEDSVNSVLSVALAALAAISIIGVLAAPIIVKLYALRLEGADRETQMQLATYFLRWFMPQMFFYGIAALAGAILNARRRFNAPAFLPILNNVVVICALISFGLIAGNNRSLEQVANDPLLATVLGAGTTAGVAIMALALIPFVRQSGFRFRWHFAPRHAAVRKVLRLSGWTVGYVAVNQIALWVVLVLANGRTGGVSAYLGAYAFFQLPHGLFTVSIMTALAPDLAAAWNARDIALVRERAATGLRLIVTVVLPAVAMYVALSHPTVVALLQRGQMSDAAASLTSGVLLNFALGLLAFSLYLFTLRVLYSAQDTRTPFVLNCVQNALNIVFALWWYPYFGIPGLALAFAMSYVVAAGISLTVLHRRIGGLPWGALGSVLARVAVAVTIAGAGAWGVATAIGADQGREAWTAFLGGLAVGAVLIVAGFWVLRVRDAHAVIAALRGRRAPRAQTFVPDPVAPEPDLPDVER